MSDIRHTPSFSLSGRDMAFISSMVSGGYFGNRTEVVRAGLRLLENYQYNLELKRLRTKIKAAESSVAEGKGVIYQSGSELAKDVIARAKKHPGKRA